MVRKRDAWTRARDRWRRRPKTPPPQTGWRIAELASLSGQPRRTIGYYVQQGLLAKPAFRETATRYGRVHLLRLLCIEHLQREGAGTLRQIKQRLEAMSEAELWAAVSAQSLGADVARALGLAAPNGAAPNGAAPSGAERGNGSGAGALRNEAGPSAAANGSAPAGSAAELPGEAWRRVPLLPGLELWVAADVSPAVRNVAREIQGYCGKR